MFKDDDEEEENTFGVTRYPCMPSLVALQQMRNRLHLAFLGRKLMKWTALATGKELRRLAEELYKVYDGFAEDLRNAFILLARSRYFFPPLNVVVTEDIAKKAGVVVQQCGRTVSGVKIIQFELFETEYPPYPHLGLDKGGQTILETKKAWLELLRRLIMMMQLRAGFLMVELANRNANKKWNVLSKMVIPRVNLSCQYITSELEEIEREDNFRLKRFKELKIKKQKAKEVNINKAISEEAYPQSSNSTTYCCKSTIVTPKVSSRSVYKGKNNKIEDDKSKVKRTKSIIHQKDSSINKAQNKNRKVTDSDKYGICCRMPSKTKSEIKNIDQKISKSHSKVICSKNKIKSNEFIHQRELDQKDSNRSNKIKPQGENKSNQDFVESVQEIKIRKILDKDGNIRVEKRTFTTTYEKKGPLSKCSSESVIYEKPSYLASKRTIEASKSNLKGKPNQLGLLKPCRSASTETSKVPRSVTLSSYKNKNDQEVQNKSNNSTSQSASVASVDYSCSDKTISACNICSAFKPPEEEKSTQTCPQYRNDTKKENQKPKSSTCIIKISAKADSDVPNDVINNNIDLTPSTLDLLRKILLQASKGSTSSAFSKSCESPKSDFSTKESGKLNQKSICSSNEYIIPNILIKKGKTQSHSCQSKPEKNIVNKEKTLSNEISNESAPKWVEIADREMKQVFTDAISESIKKSPSEVQKYSCFQKYYIIKKEYSVCSCKSKQNVDNTELKHPCSKSKNAPPEQKICTCTKVPSEDYKCESDSKQGTTKTGSYSAPKLTAICKTAKPNLDPKSCNNAKTPGDNSRPVDIIDIKSSSKCVCANKESAHKNTDSPETGNVRSLASKVLSICKILKNNLDPKSCNNAKTPGDNSRPVDIIDIKSSSKCVCANKESTHKNTDSPETGNVRSLASKVLSICKILKNNLDPECCNKSETLKTDSKPIDSIDTKICSKCPSTNIIFKPKDTDSPKTKDAFTQKESYYSHCSRNKSPERIQKASKYSLSGKKDASTLTRRSDRYDVRPLRLLMQSRTAYSCLSDSVIDRNKRSKNTRLRKSISYNDTLEYYR